MCWKKKREDMVGGPSFVFTRKAVVNENLIRDSTNWCKVIAGFDASQRYPCSMCQALPTGLCTRWELDSECGKFEPRQNKTRSFENMVMSYFQRVRAQCKVGSFYMTGTLKEIDAYAVDGFCGNCNTVFEAMGCYYHFCPCQESRPSLTEGEIQRGIKKRELDELRKQYVQEKGYNVMEMCECDRWKLLKSENIVKKDLRESFPYKMRLREERFLENIKNGRLFRFVKVIVK